MKNLALHWKILIGMALGVGFGLIMANFEHGKDFISDWIKPFGAIFINSLKLIAIPLILATLIKGISRQTNSTGPTCRFWANTVNFRLTACSTAIGTLY